MDLFKWYTDKRDNILEDISNRKKDKLSGWEKFLKQDTYLTSDLKEKFLKNEDLLHNWLFLISRKIKLSSKEYTFYLEEIKNDIGDYNSKFIEKRSLFVVMINISYL